jgi:hypothetical protein
MSNGKPSFASRMTDQSQNLAVVFRRSSCLWLYQCSVLHLNRSKRPMQSTEQPADSQRDDGSCVRLSFNAVPQPGIECSRSLSSGISCLTVKVLCGARRLIHEAFSFCLRIAGGTTDSFLNLAAEVSGCSL